MSTLAAPPPASTPPGAAAAGCALAAALAAHQGELAAVAAGRLVSLTVVLDLDPASLNRLQGGDCRWLAPHQAEAGLSLHADGVALRIDTDTAAAFRAAAADWRLLGNRHAKPLAFFTAAPASAPAALQLWVPRVLLRRSHAGVFLTLSAVRDATPVPDLARAWQREAAQLLAPAAATGSAAGVLSVATTPAPQVWQQRIAATTAAIAAGRLAKVVLSRRLDARLAERVDASRLAERLARSHPDCHVFALPYAHGHVVAASPEQLAAKRGRQLTSHALAGTARRHAAADLDAAAAATLLATPKERHEHALVVDAIAAQMAEICSAVSHPPQPAVMPQRFVQHLWTPVGGTLRNGVSLLDAVARLHPTPAVLGWPRQAAQDWLAQLGEVRDALYSGVAGWVDSDGDGDAVVVLRAAYLEAYRAVLWAGAGIMAASDAAAELAETELKLATMLEVLNVSTDASPDFSPSFPMNRP